MSDEVHESRRNTAEAWLEHLEEQGRDALIDWVQKAIETMELFEAACACLDADKDKPLTHVNGIGSHFVYPGFPPGYEISQEQRQYYLHVPADENWIGICSPEGCAQVPKGDGMRKMGRALLYAWARWCQPDGERNESGGNHER